MKQIDRLLIKAKEMTAPDKEEMYLAMIEPDGEQWKATLHICPIKDSKAFASGKIGAVDCRKEYITADTLEEIETLIKESKYNTQGEKMPVLIIDDVPHGAEILPELHLPPVNEAGA